MQSDFQLDQAEVNTQSTYDDEYEELLSIIQQEQQIAQIYTISDLIVPIKDLTYGSSDKKIKVRVSYKSPTINNRFLIDILDSNSDEARVVFGHELSKKYQNLIVEGRVYELAGLYIVKPFKGSRRKFTMAALKAIIVSEYLEDSSIPYLEPQKLFKISETNPSLGYTFIDIVLKVVKKGDKTMCGWDNKTHFVMDVQLEEMGDEPKSIVLTLWNRMIERFNFDVGQLVLLRSVRCAEKTIKLTSTGDTAFITTGLEKYQAFFKK